MVLHAAPTDIGSQNTDGDATPLSVTKPLPDAPAPGAACSHHRGLRISLRLRENTCLISAAGSVEWMCVPRPDSPSVFGAILDRGAGHFRLGPYGVTVPAARRYPPGSLIMETTWQTPTGWVIVRDALVMGPWHDLDARSRTHRRTPMDWDAEAHPAAHGTVRERHRRTGDELRAVLRLRTDQRGPGILRERLRRGHRPGPQRWRRPSDTATDDHPESASRAGRRGPHPTQRGRQRLRRTVVSGTRHRRPTRKPPTRCGRPPRHGGSGSTSALPDHPWRAYLQRSALTLKGLTYSPTGALLAASTTSLPETPHGERNWDYRYAWVRLDLRAVGLAHPGPDREADDFFSFIADVGCQQRRAPSASGDVCRGRERELVEGELDHLSGYDGPAGPHRQRRLQPASA